MNFSFCIEIFEYHQLIKKTEKKEWGEAGI
jgi:hypothetical protein